MLDLPYFKKAGNSYQDVNIRPEYWDKLENDFPEGDWADLIDMIIENSRRYLGEELERGKSKIGEDIYTQLLGIRVIFLVGK